MNPEADEGMGFAPVSEFGGSLVEIGRYHSRAEAADRGLVVLAMGHGYWVFPLEGGFALCVEPAIAEAAREQVRLSEAENAHWPPKNAEADIQPGVRRTPALIFAAVLIGTHLATSAPDGAALREAGRMDAVALIAHRQWWRVITALTLHADLGHLASNLGAGAFFAHFACRRFGAGVAWLLIVMSGALGNVATAWFYYPAEHLSIGASTAVFGALGMLAVRRNQPGALEKSGQQKRQRRTGLVSFAAAAIILGLYGAGGFRTDVLAHLTGFFWGAVFGWAASRIDPSKLAGRWLQGAAACSALLLVVSAWWLAWLLGS